MWHDYLNVAGIVTVIVKSQETLKNAKLSTRKYRVENIINIYSILALNMIDSDDFLARVTFGYLRTQCGGRREGLVGWHI